VIVGIIGIVVGSEDDHASIVPLATEGFQTFLQGPRGKPRGNW
jgi:hypothetical protein